MSKWKRARACTGTATCVEVAYDEGMISVRSTDLGGRIRVVRYSREEWEAFVSGVKDGEFDYEELVKEG